MSGLHVQNRIRCFPLWLAFPLCLLCSSFAISPSNVSMHQPRLRAAVFVNLTAMREYMSGPANSIALTPENLAGLQKANFLYHSALNSHMAKTMLVYRCSSHDFHEICSLMCKPVQICWSFQGLALEAINAGKLLWKVRPKGHKLLGSMA